MSGRTGRLLAAAAVGVLGFALSASPAFGAREWGPLQSLVHPDWYAAQPKIATTSTGDFIMAWQELPRTGGPAADERDRMMVAVRPAGQGALQVQELEPPRGQIGYCNITIGTDPEGNAVVLWENSSGDALMTRRPAGGSFGATVEIGAPKGQETSFDTNADGDIAVLQREQYSYPLRFRYVVSVSRAGGPFSAPEPLTEFMQDPAEIFGRDVAVGPGGEVAVLWGEGNEGEPGSELHAARMLPGQPPVTQLLATYDQKLRCPRIDANRAGQMAAVWTVNSNYAQCEGSTTLGLAERAPGLPFRLLPTTGLPPLGGYPLLRMSERGRTFLTYMAHAQSDPFLLATGPFGTTPTVTGRMGLHGSIVDLAMDDRGGGVIALESWGPPELYAAVVHRVTEDGRFGPQIRGSLGPINTAKFAVSPAGQVGALALAGNSSPKPRSLAVAFDREAPPDPPAGTTPAQTGAKARSAKRCNKLRPRARKRCRAAHRTR